MPMLWEKTQYTSARKDSRQGWVVRVSWPAGLATFSIWCQEWLGLEATGWLWRHPPPRGQTSAFHAKAESSMEGALWPPWRSHRLQMRLQEKSGSMGWKAWIWQPVGTLDDHQQAQQMKGTHANTVPWGWPKPPCPMLQSIKGSPSAIRNTATERVSSRGGRYSCGGLWTTDHTGICWKICSRPWPTCTLRNQNASGYQEVTSFHS